MGLDLNGLPCPVNLLHIMSDHSHDTIAFFFFFFFFHSLFPFPLAGKSPSFLPLSFPGSITPKPSQISILFFSLKTLLQKICARITLSKTSFPHFPPDKPLKHTKML